MYHRIEDQEKNPDNYVLTNVDPGMTEDECFDLLSKPRQTQKIVGLYLKKVKESENNYESNQQLSQDDKGKSLSLYPRIRHVEKEVMRNKGLWVEKPQIAAPLTYKLVEKYTMRTPIKSQQRRESRIVSNTQNLQGELEFADLYFSNRIPSGCQCSTYGEHNAQFSTWDFPFQNEADMIRQHEMNKVMKPYKAEILKGNYTQRHPIKLAGNQFGMKKKFPIYDITNL